jgi:hypothetical protein
MASAAASDRTKVRVFHIQPNRPDRQGIFNIMSGSSEPNPKPEDGDAAARIRCLYCGASNFPSVAACWQCGRPLRPLPSVTAATSTLGGQPTYSKAATPTRGSGAAEEDGKLAVKAAVTLGLMFPYVAIPVGMVFLMLDDDRKTRLGWITIGWSLAGTAASILLFFLTLAPLFAVLKALVPQTGHGGGLPDLHIPGVGSGDLNLLVSSQVLRLAWQHHTR